MKIILRFFFLFFAIIYFQSVLCGRRTGRSTTTARTSTTRGQCYKTFYCCKLQIFVISQSVHPSKPLQDTIVFAGKARAFPSGIPFRYSTLGQAPGLAHKQYHRLERLARGKHYSSLQKFVTYGRKKFYIIGPRCQCYSAFTVASSLSQTPNKLQYLPLRSLSSMVQYLQVWLGA